MRLVMPLLLLVSSLCSAGERVTIGSADFAPVLAPAPGVEWVHVASFRMDRNPVTNGQFLEFVRAHPEWRRDRVARLFADREYLSHWAAPDAPGPQVLAQQPVTRVSWFAARAYCAAEKARLPTWYEWELAAATNQIQDLHELIWEWVEDFSSLMVSGDSRTQGDPDKLAYCGAGALSARDRTNYPILMRIAYLSAQEARSTGRVLGFRCAAEVAP